MSLEPSFSSLGKNLKVRTPEKYGWEPRRVLSQLVDIYLHLESDDFASALAGDEVCVLSSCLTFDHEYTFIFEVLLN